MPNRDGDHHSAAVSDDQREDLQHYQRTELRDGRELLLLLLLLPLSISKNHFVSHFNLFFPPMVLLPLLSTHLFAPPSHRGINYQIGFYGLI